MGTTPQTALEGTPQLNSAGAATGLTSKIVQTYFTQVLRLVLSAVVTILIARALGPNGRGLFAVATAIGTLGIQLGNLGMHASNTYIVARDRSLLPQLLSNSLAASLVFGAVIATATWIVCQLWPAIAPLHGKLFVVALVSIPVGLAYLLLQSLLLALHWVRWYNALEIFSRAAQLGLVAWIIVTRRVSPATFVLAATIVTACCLIPAFGALNQKLRLPARPSARLFFSSVGLSTRAYIVCLLGFLVLRLDLLMIQRMSGLQQAGWYSIATSLADYIMLLPTVVAGILFPRLSSMSDVAEKLRLTGHAVLCTAAFMLPCVLILSLAIKILIRMLFGAAFLPASQAFVLLMPGVFFLGIETIIVQFLNSEGFPKIIIGVWTLAVALNVALNLFLIPRFGIAGASIASSICYTLVFLLMALVIVRTLRKAREAAL